MNIQGWFPLGLTGLISLQSKGLSRVFSNTTVWKHQFFSAQFSLWSSTWVSGCYLLHLRNEEPEVRSVCDLLNGIHTVNRKARTRPKIPPPTRVSCPQSLPASGSFPRIRFFASGGQSIVTNVRNCVNIHLFSFNLATRQHIKKQKHYQQKSVYSKLCFL